MTQHIEAKYKAISEKLYALKKYGERRLNKMGDKLVTQCSLITDTYRRRILFQVGITDDPWLDIGGHLAPPKDDLYS